LSTLLGAGSALGRFCLFLGRLAVTSASAVQAVLYFVLFQWLVVGMWLGHEERPGRVLLVAILVLVVTWMFYWQVGTFVLDSDVRSPTVGSPTWRNALYNSLVSFAALGYGAWAPTPVGWAQWVGAAESFLGIFSAVFFSVTLGQRIAR